MSDLESGCVTRYRVIETTETIDGCATAMYGIEGFSKGEFVVAFALSTERERIAQLVNSLNASGMQLSQLKMVLKNFSQNL